MSQLTREEARCSKRRRPLTSAGHASQCITGSDEVPEIRPPERCQPERVCEGFEADFFPLITAAREFKTPLGVMLGYTELLRSCDLGHLTKKQLDVVNEIKDGTRRLQSMIQSLLLLSELRDAQGHHGDAARVEPTDVNETMKSIFHSWSSAAKLKSIVYEFRASPGAPRVRVEPLKLQHIISNLIENALHYTPVGGQVTVSVEECFWDRRKKQSGSLFGKERRENRRIKNAVCLAVTDTGPGIASKHHDDIFREFIQLPGASSRGTGLGLAIARRLVEAHRGAIWVESKRGNGSRFLVLLTTSQESHKHD